MMTWQLIDIDGNAYTITLPNFRLMEMSLKVDLTVIERSNKAGGILSGNKRDKSRELQFQYDYWETNVNLVNYIDELLYWLSKAVKIKNVERNIETDIALSGHDIKWEAGSVYKLFEGTVTFKQLTPYFWDVTAQTDSLSSVSGADILTITNAGKIETPPTITVTALDSTSKFSIKNAASGEGIYINDLDYSLNGLNTYIIDCKEGTVELNGYNRRNKVKNGTGPFTLLPGDNELEIYTNGIISIEVEWRRRYYL